MPKRTDKTGFHGWGSGQIKTQALIVTNGPFTGRICENDDDDFCLKSDFRSSELSWFKKCGVQWQKRELEEGEEFDPKFDVGVDCEIVTFGFYLQCNGTYYIPRQFLRPTTTKDLVQRHGEISEIVSLSAWSNEDKLEDGEVVSLLKEQNYILNEIWARENSVVSKKGSRNVFLCHSSADKPFVKQVFLDLGRAGHSPWLDEYEIGVGDSIVAKIDEGSTKAGALILFLSQTAIESSWVKREWNSALARQLSQNNVTILPALIEDCAVPSILADIKFADFRESYHTGLDQILSALKKNPVQKQPRQKGI